MVLIEVVVVVVVHCFVAHDGGTVRVLLVIRIVGGGTIHINLGERSFKSLT